MTEWVEGRISGKTCWTDRLYSLQIDAPVEGFKAGQFVKVALDLEGDHIGRPYSFVNAPDRRPLEIYFNEVPEGPLTPRLSRLIKGDPIWLSARASGVFTLDNVPEARNLWLFATGTALGVYLAILATDEPWQRFERIVLVHGVRSADELTYGERIGDLLHRRRNQFTFVPVLSRAQQDDALHGRIPPLLENGLLEQRAGLRVETETSHVMLCGNSHMIKDMKALLEARGMQRHRRHEPGHYTTEQYH